MTAFSTIGRKAAKSTRAAHSSVRRGRSGEPLSTQQNGGRRKRATARAWTVESCIQQSSSDSRFSTTEPQVTFRN